MKRLLVLFSLLSVFTFSLIAQENTVGSNKLAPEKTESKWSSLSYENIPVLKILEANDAYVVLYQKYHLGVGSVVIPKKWATGNVETPKKLKFRNAKTVNSSFMTIVKKNGEFSKVILTVPSSRSSGIWRMVKGNQPTEGADKDTLEDIDL